MLIHTIQRLEAWLKFQQRGLLKGDGRRADRHMKPHYDWMRSQMARRIPGYRGGYPLWGWYRPKQDLRSWRHWWKEPSVLLVVDVPAERVLLSDYDVWHVVLNCGFVSLTEEEDRYYEEEVLPPGRYDGMPRRYQEIVEDSWERIFDLEALARSPVWHCDESEPSLQACIEWVTIEEVVRVKPFNLKDRRPASSRLSAL